MNIITKVVKHFGGRQKVADIFGITYMSVVKWEKNGRFPYTDYAGETDYAERLANLSDGKFTKDELLPPIKRRNKE